jgi:hypothetical protein
MHEMREIILRLACIMVDMKYKERDKDVAQSVEAEEENY